MPRGLPQPGEPATPFVREERKVGRNEPCPCGSGKKFKHCHGNPLKDPGPSPARAFSWWPRRFIDAHGQLLIAERPAGKHMAGRWEFPGGKVAPTESERAALERELREELGIEVESAQPLMRLAHSYDDRDVDLSLWVIGGYRGTPRSLEGQRLKWVAPARLAAEDILEADQTLRCGFAGAPRALVPPGRRVQYGIHPLRQDSHGSAGRTSEIQLDPTSLYREDVFTDRRAGSIRRLTPVTSDGADDATRHVLYSGQTQLLTPAGVLPLGFEIEAFSLKEALEKFPPPG